MEDGAMHRTMEIHRRPGGSIDTGYYARIGRELHGIAMRQAAKSLVGRFRVALGKAGRRLAVSRRDPHAEPVFCAAE